MDASGSTVAFIPIKAETCEKRKEISKVTEKGFKFSIYHEIQGEFRTPPYGRLSSKNENLNASGSKDTETTPHSAFVDYKKRLIAKQSIESELRKLKLETSDIRRTEIKYVEKTEFFPFEDGRLHLCLSYFDDMFQFETKTPKDWIQTSMKDKTVARATTLLPVKDPTLGSSQEVTWEWQDVRVLGYCEENQMYRVTKYEGEPSLQSEDLLIPRIYLKFATERPKKFANRLKCAVMNRHLVQESFRIALNIEYMPIDNLPSWSQLDMERIFGNARRGLVREIGITGIIKLMQEINLDYKRAYNYMSYWSILKENPSLMDKFRSGFMSHKSHNQLTKVEVTTNFQKNLKHFTKRTFWSTPEIWNTLYDVQKLVLSFSEITIYQFPEKATGIDEFEKILISHIETVEFYVRDSWIYEISTSVCKNLSRMEKGNYDTHQKVEHAFQNTKLSRLLRRVTLVIQATVCDWVNKSLQSFTKSIITRCRPSYLINETFKWKLSLNSNRFAASCEPLFLVPLVLKKGLLEFGIDMSRCSKIIIDLFERSLVITGGLPEILKIVMQDMKIYTKYQIRSVSEDHPEIVSCRGKVITGMNKALIAAKAYVSAYDEILKVLNTVPATYKRLHNRLNTSDKDIIKTINMHMQEEKRLEEEIPECQDIGPFRFVTIEIRNAIVKRHKELATVLTQSFHSDFLSLLSKIEIKFEAISERIVTKSNTLEDLDRKHLWLNRGYNKDLENFQKEIGKLNTHYAFLLNINYNIEDDDFTRLSNIRMKPKTIVSMVTEALNNFVQEREIQRDFYQNEKYRLIVKMFLISSQISAIGRSKGVVNVSERLEHVRKIRMRLEKYNLDLCVQQRRERLLGICTADQSAHLRKIADNLGHHENWLESAKEFQKLQEFIMANPRAVDKNYVQAKIRTVKFRLSQSVEHFKNTTTLQHLMKVQNEVDYFVKTILSKLV